MAAPIVTRSNGDIIDADDHNSLLEYIESGTYRVNSLSLNIGGTEVIDSSRNINLANITNKQTTISDSDTNFPTSGAVVDYSLPLTGGTLTGNLIIDNASFASMVIDGGGIGDSGLYFKNAGANKWLLHRDYSDGNDLKIYNYGVGNDIMHWDYATNKVKLATGGYVNEFSTDGTLAGNSDDAVPTEKAVKTYVDASGGSDNDLDPTPNSDHTANGLTSTLVAGENLVFGNIGYMKSDGKVWKADADAAATMPGIYLCLATINAAASGSFLLIGFARDDTWTWTVGGKVYVSCTAGALTQTAPTGSLDVVQVVGIATHADRLYFKPDLETVELA